MVTICCFLSALFWSPFHDPLPLQKQKQQQRQTLTFEEYGSSGPNFCDKDIHPPSIPISLGQLSHSESARPSKSQVEIGTPSDFSQSAETIHTPETRTWESPTTNILAGKCPFQIVAVQLGNWLGDVLSFIHLFCGTHLIHFSVLC